MTEVTTEGGAATTETAATTGGESGTTTTQQAAGTEAEQELARARHEAQRFRTELREAQAALKKHEDAGKTELEKAQGTISEMTKAKESAESLAARYEVALDHGLTKAQAKRLVGTTAAELEADAKALAEELGISADGSDRRPVDTGAGVRRGTPTGTKLEPGMNSKIVGLRQARRGR